MLGELAAVLATLDFEENGAVLIAAARWLGDRTCRLLLDVQTGAETEPRQAWLIRCADARTARVNGDWAASVALTTDHPLLLPYTQPRAELAFRGHAPDPRAVVGDLWEAHRAATGAWYPFEWFFNRGLPLAELLATGGGVLAEGPRPVLDAYAAAVAAHSVESSILAERPPLRWLDGAWQPEPGRLRALVIGDSYVVAADFDVARMPVEHLDAVT